MSGSDTASPPESLQADDPDIPTPNVSALHTSPDRLILTEEGNADGWIASDVAVGLDTQT